MVRTAESLIGYIVLANDGDIGQVVGLYFESTTWHVRYLIVDTGSWLPGRKILLSTPVVDQFDLERRTLSVDLQQQQVENSPDIDTLKTISRQNEEALHNHYGWPVYWTQSVHFLAKEGVEAFADTLDEAASETTSQSQLRSIDEVLGYRVWTTDDEIGVVDDFIIDDARWMVASLIVTSSSTLLTEKRVLVPCQSVETISWAEANVQLNITSAVFENSDEFDPASPVNMVKNVQTYDYQGNRRD